MVMEWTAAPLGDCHRERVEATQQKPVPAGRFARGGDLREPAEQPGESDCALEPGQRRADAEVRAAAEAERPTDGTQGIEPGWLGEPARIPVPRPEQRDHPGSRGYPNAAHRRGLPEAAGELDGQVGKIMHAAYSGYGSARPAGVPSAVRISIGSMVLLRPSSEAGDPLPCGRS